MKIQKTDIVSTEVEVSLESVGMHFDHKGITAMVSLEDGLDESEEYLLSWDEVLSWAMASSQKDGDAEIIIDNLRNIASKLEAWNNRT